ncbi:MAG: alpha/beta hydrolase [Opitutaceae bacterium]|nr:alpha/beta hydrolase [Opitutaceae bacterium]
MTPARWWWRLLRTSVIFAAVVFLSAMIGARFLAERMLYYPDVASRRLVDGTRKITDDTGNEIAVVHLPSPPARFTIWFFHGNAEALGDIEPFLRMLHQAGYGVVAFDYPGYGVSSGKPSESALNTAARAVRHHLRDELKVPANRTLILGRSLGGGPAVQMATEERVAGLILQSTFTSVFRVMTRWRLLPSDLFESERKLPRVGCPVLVMHGQRDAVIPFHHGLALFAAASEPKRSLFVENAGHNDFLIAADAAFWRALREFSELAAK